jgi:hypothetical protein
VGFLFGFSQPLSWNSRQITGAKLMSVVYTCYGVEKERCCAASVAASTGTCIRACASNGLLIRYIV